MTENSRQKANAWSYPRHRYFEQSLRRSASAWFKKKGYATDGRYPHRLSEWNEWPSNILLADVVAYVRGECKGREKSAAGFPLHNNLHNGLSSQAMLFNLVGPLIVRKDLEPLSVAFSRTRVPFPEATSAATFEIEDRAVLHEDYGQPTSIDLVIEGDSASPGLFIEAKLVEREFGGCSVFSDGDCEGRNPASDFDLCYLHYVGRTYWTRLVEFGFLQGGLKEGPICPLAMYYQFFRELLFALAKGGYFVLLYDNRNPVFYRDGDRGPRGLVPFLIALVPTTQQDKIRGVTIQDVVQAIKESGRHGDWIGEFESKYGMTGETK